MPILHIKVKPQSKIDSLFYENGWNLKIKAPAKEGKANEYLQKYLAKLFNTNYSKVKILSGFTNPFKKIEIEISEPDFNSILEKFRPIELF